MPKIGFFKEEDRMDLEGLLNKTLKPALGCTEPVAVAFGVAAASQAVGGWRPGQDGCVIHNIPAADVLSIRVRVNRNIFKNAFSIYIPNTGGHKGIVMAAALGVWCNPAAGLQLFHGLDPENVTKARYLIEQGRVSIEIVSADHTDLFIEAHVRLRRGSEIHEGASVVQDEHTNLVLLKCDGNEIFRKSSLPHLGQDLKESLQELAGLTFEDLVRMAGGLPESAHPLLLRTIELNRSAAEIGLEQPLGLGVGYYGSQSGEPPGNRSYLADGSAGGSDARMSGYPVEVMSSAGSGNQGIIATLPVYSYCREAGIDGPPMLKAIALSHLVTMYVTSHVGYLSSLCGVAIKAGIGAACGITYAMGGGVEEIQRAVKIVAATLSGVICDGAKPGCALKVSSSSDIAFRAASLAMKNVDISDENGIVADTAENTVRNLARLNQSMSTVEEKIIQIMQEKIRLPKSPGD